MCESWMCSVNGECWSTHTLTNSSAPTCSPTTGTPPNSYTDQLKRHPTFAAVFSPNLNYYSLHAFFPFLGRDTSVASWSLLCLIYRSRLWNFPTQLHGLIKIKGIVYVFLNFWLIDLFLHFICLFPEDHGISLLKRMFRSIFKNKVQSCFWCQMKVNQKYINMLSLHRRFKL